MPVGPSTHLSLLGRLRDRDDASAWQDFHHRYGVLIARVARGLGLQAADCEDVTQDVLVELTRTFEAGHYDPERGRFRSYLKRIVQRTVFRRFRQNRARPRQGGTDATAPDGEAAADHVWETEWRRYHVGRAMPTIEAEFSEINRLAFTFMTVNGKSARETAEALGISADRAYQAKSRILARLAVLIEAQVAEEG